MAKKYLSIQEAADQLGMSTDDLTRLREKGEIRGFADRGTWKFKLEDIEKLGRVRQTDSDPDVTMIGADAVIDSADSLLGDEDLVAEQPTTIASGSNDDDFAVSLGGPTSDSDVRLVLDEPPLDGSSDSSPDVGLLGDTQSDSDVRLVGESVPVVDDSSSDSDVKLVGTESDSDVRLVTQDDEGLEDSDSDVTLVSSGAGMSEESDDSIPLSFGGDLELGGDSGISLISEESGISLGSPADSGISLEGDDESGISLVDDSQSGGGANDDLNQTMPMLETPLDDVDMDDTEFEVPALDNSDASAFELVGLDDEKIADTDETNVLLIDDDDDIAASGKNSDVFDLEGDEFDDVDELSVADDVLGEDDELEDLDVFGGDDDFDDDFESGESQAEFAAPLAGRGRVAAATMDADWGTGTFVGLSISTLAMCMCGMVVFDLVRTMWSGDDPSAFSGPMIDMFGGLFK